MAEKGLMILSLVSIVRCKEYREEAVEKAVRDALKLTGGIDDLLKKGTDVLLKPNVLSAKPPERAVTTHPVFVKAVVKVFREMGFRVMVGDSSGGAIAGVSQTEKALKVSGIYDAVLEAGGEVINFDKTGTLPVNINGTTYHISKPVVEAPIVVSLPKFKTHSATLYTGAVKNMYGCIPGLKKAHYHRVFPNPNAFSSALGDIFQACRVDLAVMDGVIGMEGNGPAAGNPRRVGIVMASRDSVALDTVASYIMGFNPAKIPHIAECSKRALGVGRLNEITVIGEKPENVRPENFRLPSNELLTRLPSFLGRRVLRLLVARPRVNPRECTGCRVCVDNCPVKVIRMNRGYPEIDYRGCIECLCCHELCPKGAVELKYDNPVLDFLMRFKRKSR